MRGIGFKPLDGSGEVVRVNPAGLAWLGLLHHRLDALASEAERSRLLFPLHKARVYVETVVLRLAGAVGGGLRRGNGEDAVLLHPVGDLPRSGAEGVDQRAGEALEVGIAVLHRLEFEAELTEDAGAEHGLKNDAGRLRMGIKRRAATRARQ